MNFDEVKSLIQSICDATAEAVDHYVSCTGEDTEQLDERVMQVGAALRLSETGRTVLIEVGGKTIRRRLGTLEDRELEIHVEDILEKFANGKVDMVITSSEGDPVRRKPIGYIEFKKWKHITNDGGRVAELSRLPGANFGCIVVLRNSIAEDPIIRSVSENVPYSIVIAKNTNGKNKDGHPCCVVCIAQLGSAVR